VEALEDRHELVLSDLFDIPSRHESRCADLRELAQVLPLAWGCDFVVHTPAWHGMHGGLKSEVDYWQLNIDGAFHVFQSALQNNVRHMVWVSSVSIAGWERDKYGFSKFIGEHLCGYYHRVHGMRIGIIRPWDFTPYGGDFIRYGERLLAGGVDRRDVVDATVKAIELVRQGSIQCEWFEIGKDHPFTAADCERFKRNPREVVESYWPGYGGLMDKYAIRFPERAIVCDLERTKSVLGFQPRYDFGTFLAELQERDAKGIPVR
jgi:nucleoside-diphosphate-sugar epimerase